jgi:hypothetical protein
MLMANSGHRHTAFGLAQDRKDLGFCVSACLHKKIASCILPRKTYFRSPLLSGGITDEPGLLAVAEGRLCSFVGCTPGITSKSASFAGRTGVQIESPRACGMIMKHLQQK